MRLENAFIEKIVLVTGGGSGIGYAIAKQFLENGAKVIITGRNVEKLVNANKELSKIGECYFRLCDIRRIEEIEKLREYISNEFGRLDILINNAGGQFPSMAKDLSINGWTAVVNNNLNGTFYITQILAKAFFIPQREGSIVSIIANIYRGFPGMAHTGAARAGVDNLTKTLAVEWSPYHIRINAVAPGVIQSTGLNQYPEGMMDGVADKIPMKRFGSVDDVANSVLFLASNYAGYITGETLYVDGGQRLYGDVFKL